MMKITLFALFAGLVIMVITVISLVYKEAHAWWSVAEANGHQKAAKDLGIVTKKEMSKEQIADAQSLSIEIQKRIEANAENKPDLSNTVPSKDPIKSAVEFSKLQDRNGYKYLPNTDKPYSGWAKGTYDNGQVKELTQFKEGNVVLATSWHENGQQKWKQNLKGGKQDGLFTSWHENGQKREEVKFIGGKQEGLAKRWRKNGRKSEEGNWKNGKSISALSWKPDGEKCSLTNLKDGNGIVIGYYDNGQKSKEAHYKDGKFISTVVWKPNGEKCLHSNLKNGNGVVLWYNEDGMEHFNIFFKGGVRARSLPSFNLNKLEFHRTKRLAEGGGKLAQYLIGNAYRNGDGVPQDYKQAVKWYSKSAEQGVVSAQFNLSNMYYNGEGVIKDYVTAYAWLGVAKANELAVAVKFLDIVRKTMSKDQIAEGQKLARELSKRIEANKKD